MVSALQKLPDNTLELTITIPWSEVKSAYEKVMTEVVKNAEIKGFRKGKAPRKIVEERTDKNKIYSLTLEDLLPKFYSQAVKEQNIQPIVNPKVTVVSMDEGKDWVFKAKTCEKPEVSLGDYKKEIQGEFAKEKIWLPGKGNQEPTQLRQGFAGRGTKDKEEDKQKRFNRVIEVLLKTANIKLPEILIEDEVGRLLSQTLDEIKRLGLTLDQYLASTGKTVELLKEEARIKAEASLKLEFILEKIAEGEKIIVTDKDIDEEINKNPDKKIQEALEKNRYLLATVIRRQKTLDFLNDL